MSNISGFSRAAALVPLLLSLANVASAVDTHVWQQNDANEFTRGTIKNLSVRSDGRLTLAPVFHEIADLATPYLWAAVEDSHGTLYCAGGAPTGSTAKVFEVNAQGKSRAVAELSGLEIHALAVDQNDRVYAATSPDSKVYRIGSDGKPELFYDTKAKYVWSIAFDRAGNLYIATGDQGVIYRVTPDGKGSEFFRTEETHARSMIVDPEGNLIVGTEPGGYVLRITPQGKSFVLFQSSKREITALAEHKNVLYAAATGTRAVQPTLVTPPPPATPAPAPPGSTKASTTAQQQPPTQAPSTPTLAIVGGLTSGGTGGSDFYRIDQDGFADKLWSSPADVIYGIGFDAQGKPLLGTGNKGVIYRVDSALLSTQLLNAPPTQVTAFAPGRNGTLYAVTGNVGKVYVIGPGLAKTGSLESEVLDAGSFAYWGKAHLISDLHRGKIALSTRSGNVNRPQKNWSDWSPVEMSTTGGQVTSPEARFLQYKLAISESPDGQSPELSTVQLAFLPRNVAPLVRIVQVEDANYRASTTPNFLERATTASGAPMTLSLQPLGQPRKGTPPALGTPPGGLTLQYAKGYVTVRWHATDDNGDSLIYRVEIQGKGETVWRLLKDKIQDTHYSFDGSAFADGHYIVRVTASDEPSNTPAQALSSSTSTDPFTIDNTPPQLISTGIRTENNQTVIRFSAKDALSWIDRAEYSVNGSEWVLLEPLNRVSDSQQLNYELKVPTKPEDGQQVIAVRVFDENDNEAVTRFVTPGP
jgi:sugar lactone lactonase YvrE